MKFVIREYLKSKRATAYLIAVLITHCVKAWAVVQIALGIPATLESGNPTGPEMVNLVVWSVVAVVMDMIHEGIRSRPQRAFFTDTMNRYTKALSEADYDLYTKYSLSYILGAQGFAQDGADLGKLVANVGGNIFSMVLSSYAIVYLAPEVLKPIGLMYLTIPIVLWPVYKKVAKLKMKQKDEQIARDQVIEDMVYGFAEVRLANRTEVEYQRVVKHHEAIYERYNQMDHLNVFTMLMASGGDGAGSIVVVLYLLGRIASGTMSVGTAVAIVGMAGTVLGALMNILDMIDGSSESLSRVEKYKDVMSSAQKTIPNGTLKMSSLKEGISIRDVSFAYGSSADVLNGVSMEIPAGSKVGICGRSGDGKSTLLKLLCKFYDFDHGGITFDGVDIRDLTKESVYAQLGVVSQDVMIFPGTILDNVRYARPMASEYEIIEACKKAELYDFILTLPNQLQTEVGPRGIKLSGGERQRVALARMFLKNPAVIILDEATSALDNELERAIQRAIEKFHGKTIIMVAHRLTTIQNCDSIFVMENGHIVEQGNHEELKSRGGIYAKMLNASIEE